MASVLLAHALHERGIVVAALHPGWVQTDMGGPNATVPAADSVRGLLAVIDGLALEDSGSFRDWRGGTLPWCAAGAAAAASPWPPPLRRPGEAGRGCPRFALIRKPPLPHPTRASQGREQKPAAAPSPNR